MPYTLIADSHQISSYQTCEQRYYLYDIKHLRPKKIKKSLDLGTIFHEALSLHYRGKPFTEVWTWLKTNEGLAEIAEEERKYSKNGEAENYQDLLSKRYLDYCTHYKDRDWTNVVAVEDDQDSTGFSKVIYENDIVRFIYEGKIDLIVNVSGVNTWVDHKTQGAKFPYDRNEYVNQFLGYSWALGNNNGIINYITWSKKVYESTFRRQAVSFGQDLIDEWRRETIQTYWDMLKSIFDNDWRRRRSACDTKYGPCLFQPICKVVSTKGQEWVMGQEFQKTERRFAWSLNNKGKEDGS